MGNYYFRGGKTEGNTQKANDVIVNMNISPRNQILKLLYNEGTEKNSNCRLSQNQPTLLQLCKLECLQMS